MPRKKKSPPEIVTPPSDDKPLPVVEPSEVSATAAPAEPETSRTWASSGPVWFQTVNLSDRNDGPHMRLGRDHRFQQMAIAFDEKPTAEVLQELREDGWRWRGQEGQWTKQLLSEQRAAGHLAAEQLFGRLANLERREHGVSDTPAASR